MATRALLEVTDTPQNVVSHWGLDRGSRYSLQNLGVQDIFLHEGDNPPLATTDAYTVLGRRYAQEFPTARYTVHASQNLYVWVRRGSGALGCVDAA